MSLLAAQRGRQVHLTNNNIKKDEQGFEDISDFWDSADVEGGRDSVERSSSAYSYDYDDTGSITEDDYEDEVDDNEDGIRSKRNSTSNAPTGGRRSSALQLEDTPAVSTVASSASKSSRKPSLSPLDTSAVFMDDHNYDDGFNDDYQDELDTSSKSNRRVSFGAGTKEDGKNKSHVKTPRYSASSAGTPESAATTVYSMVSTPGSEDFPRGQRISDASFRPDNETDEDEDDELNDSNVTESSFLQSVEKQRVERRLMAGSDDEESEEDEDGGTRRSRRRTKGQRFQFWKNERPVYQQGEMIGFLTANPTPKKPKRSVKQHTKKYANKRAKNDDEGVTDDEEISARKKRKLFNPRLLPKEYKYLDRDDVEELSLWDDPNDKPTQLKVICFKESLEPPSALPITSERPPEKQIVGYAAQSFNQPEIPGVMSGWISGFVELPPGAIKDAEGVGECSQVFFVTDCQDGALEVGIADPSDEEWNDQIAQRLCLKKGDSFFIPPGNIYRLENHSEDVSVMINWTIIKPMEQSTV